MYFKLYYPETCSYLLCRRYKKLPCNFMKTKTIYPSLGASQSRAFIKQIWSALLCVTLLSFSSCEKPDPVEPLSPQSASPAINARDGITIAEGRLIFPDTTLFLRTIQERNQTADARIIDWERSSNYESLYGRWISRNSMYDSTLTDTTSFEWI